MITLSELSLSGLMHTNVTKNWIVYQVEGVVLVKKSTWTYQHSTMWMAVKTKRLLEVL